MSEAARAETVLGATAKDLLQRRTRGARRPHPRTTGGRGSSVSRAKAEDLESRLLLSTVTFQPAVAYSVGNDPESVAVADLGNGVADLVVANTNDSTVGVLIGNGDGTFKTEKTYATGQGPWSVAVANLGNGHPDVVTANESANTVTVLLGNGDGTFKAQTETYTVGTDPQAVAITDLGNGHLDLVVANGAGNTVSVLMGNGNGTFQAQQTFNVGSFPSSVAVADLGNGHPDLVIANADDNTVSVLLGDGTGAFQTQRVFATGTHPNSVAVMNLGNGKEDIVTANLMDGTASVLLGNGDGTFNTQQSYAVGVFPNSVAIADLGNGTPDLIVGNDSDSTVSVLVGNGDGTFQGQQTFPAGPAGNGAASVAVANLGNSSPDIVVADNGGGTVSVLLGANGTGGGGGGGTGGGSTTGLVPTITKSTVPHAVVGGSVVRGSVTLSVNNSTSAIDSGPNPIAVYASNDGTVDSNSILLGKAKPSLKLKAGATQNNIVVPINAASVPAGNYTLFAQATDPSSDIVTSAPGFALAVSAPFLAFSETVTTLGLASSVVSGTKSNAMARVVIVNSGNVAAKGSTTIDLSASTTPGVAGTAINSITTHQPIAANGGKATVLVPFKALPNLADNSYYITADVTDPMGGSSIASTAGTTTIAAPFITLALAFGNIPRGVLTAGAPLIITNSGNIDDTSTFAATIGFSFDAAGTNMVGTTAGALAPARVTVRAGKTASIHVTGWNPLFKSLVSTGPYFLTVTLTDANGNSASAVSAGEV